MTPDRKCVLDEHLDLIPHLDLSVDDKSALEKIMGRGAEVIKTYHARIQAKKQCKYSRVQFRKELFKAVACSPGVDVVLHGVGISKSDIALVMKVREIEWTVLRSVGKLVFQHARKWAFRKHGCNMEFSDFYNEATIAVINAIYGYSKGSKFITYCQHAIHRRILNATNEAKPLSPWSQKGKKLYGQFSEMRTKLGQEVSFDEVVKLMQLDDSAVRALRAMLASVINSSDVVESSNFDLTECPIEKLEDGGNRVDSSEIINSTPMSEWERTVLNAYLHGGHGWATQVAQEHVNPVTQDRYSRRAPKLALDRVLERIRQKYEETAGNSTADAA